jgi:FkbM family methyltransferase
MKELVKKALKRAGFELIRRRPHLVDLLVAHRVDVVLDAGANTGQFGEYLRAGGYRGRIVSFEPLPEAFEALERKAARDGAWTALNVGLGNAEKVEIINVSRSTVYSSILCPLPALTRFAGAAVENARQREITLHTLDSQFPLLVGADERAFLKIDTQGYEKQVIVGARSSLARIVGLQLELSLTPLYAGESSLPEMVSLLERSGYQMALFDPVTYDPAARVLLQIDCVFFKKGFGPFEVRESLTVA